MVLNLYSTHCPKCKVIEMKLKQANLDFTIIDDEQTILDKGFSNMPVLEVDGSVLQFVDANKFLNGLLTRKG